MVDFCDLDLNQKSNRVILNNSIENPIHIYCGYH